MDWRPRERLQRGGDKPGGGLEVCCAHSSIQRHNAQPHRSPPLALIACFTLRTALKQSPLLDHAGQAARFGAALRSCWAAWCARTAAAA